MNILDYNDKAIKTIVKDYAVDDLSPQLIAYVFGLTGESGEVSDKFKKLIRDKQGALNETDKREILKELGDVLWYVTSISNLLGSNLEQVANINLQKTFSRKARGKQHGNGDDR